MTFHAPNQYRVRKAAGPWNSTDKDGNNGLFMVPVKSASGEGATIVASDGMGWEHVSVSFPGRTPTWEQMCEIKDLFWDEDDCVVQYHPPKTDYVNNHEHCLHLWRPIGLQLPIPKSLLVGVKGGARE